MSNNVTSRNTIPDLRSPAPRDGGIDQKTPALKVNGDNIGVDESLENHDTSALTPIRTTLVDDNTKVDESEESYGTSSLTLIGSSLVDEK